MYNNTYNQFGGYPMGGQLSNQMGMYGLPHGNQQNQTQQAQTIQTLEQKPLQAVCYFVKSVEDFKVDVLPGVYYLGINEDAKELYIKRIKEDGTSGLETYKLSLEKKEKTDLQIIADRLTNIEKHLTGLKGNKNDSRPNNTNAPDRN